MTEEEARRAAELDEAAAVELALDQRPDLVPARSQASWRRHVLQHPDVAVLRADALNTLTKMVWLVMVHADWDTLATRPGVDVIAERIDKHRRTVQRWFRWLEARGLLLIAEPGSTPHYRPMALAHVTGNRRQVWVLTLPVPAAQQAGQSAAQEAAQEAAPDRSGAVHQDGQHLDSRSDDQAAGEVNWPVSQGSGDRVVHENVAPPSFAGLTGEACSPRTRARLPQVRGDVAVCWPLGRSPASKGQARQAAEVLQQVNPVFRAIPSTATIRFALRDFFAAGWTPDDVLFALDHEPDGRAWKYAFRTDQLHHPARWVLFRLSHWRTPDTPDTPDGEGGEPMRSRSQRLAAEAAHAKARIRAAQERNAAEAAAAVEARGRDQAGTSTARAAYREARRRLFLTNHGDANENTSEVTDE